ncbi:hypothetical protein Tco_0111862 [Tanacetum coccineum]
MKTPTNVILMRSYGEHITVLDRLDDKDESLAVKNVVENESHFSLEVVDDGLSSLAIRNSGIGGSMSRVGEGINESMGGMGGGSLARCLMVSNDGRGGGGLVVAGGRSSRELRKT